MPSPSEFYLSVPGNPAGNDFVAVSSGTNADCFVPGSEAYTAEPPQEGSVKPSRAPHFELSQFVSKIDIERNRHLTTVIQTLYDILASHEVANALSKKFAETLTTDSPFDLIFDTEEKRRHALVEEIKSLQRPYAQRLYRRLLFLSTEAEEEYPDEEALLSISSLEGFLRFMRLPEKFVYPDVTVTADGNLRVQWQEDKKHHFAIEFISETEAKCVVFAPDPRYATRVARASFKLSIDSIVQVVAPLGALQWATE